MDYRTRQPGALIRRAAQQAEASGTSLDAVIRALLELYVSHAIDPLAPDPIASAIGSRGGRASAERLTAEARREKARKAAAARWSCGDHVGS
jgi:hypothetical protein